MKKCSAASKRDEKKSVNLDSLGPDKKESHNHLDKTNLKEVVNTKKNDGKSMGHK